MGVSVLYKNLSQLRILELAKTQTDQLNFYLEMLQSSASKRPSYLMKAPAIHYLNVCQGHQSRSNVLCSDLKKMGRQEVGETMHSFGDKKFAKCSFSPPFCARLA